MASNVQNGSVRRQFLSYNSFYAHLFVAFARIMRRFMASNMQKTGLSRQKVASNIRFYVINLRLIFKIRILDATVSPQGL